MCHLAIFPALEYKEHGQHAVTNSGGGGFNQLRLFSRSGGGEVQTADIGMIRVYNGVVTLAQVQSQYAAFKTRFGY